MYQMFEDKIDELLDRMTLREKIGQLHQVSVPKNQEEAEACKEMIRKGELGSIILAGIATAGNDGWRSIDVELCNELQRSAVEESRNGIPLIYGRDVIHGHRTVYPIPLAMAASFDEELIEKCYRNTAKEAAADSVHWTFAPMLDLSRDPRWGRVVEGPGEDPHVAVTMAKACIRGFQGEDLSKEDSLVACAKHFIGYGASEGGRDYHRTEISDYSLYNYYLPAFRAAADAGVGTFMSSFNDINGQPVTSGKRYLTDILRGELGFEGYVVSDWGAVEQLMRQGVAGNTQDCARLAIEAGVDMDMCSSCYMEKLETLVEQGMILEETIDLAVRRILRIKFAKGLFAHPYCKQHTVDRTEHLLDARRMAAESMVLLKNDGALPIDKERTVALLGPFVKERRSLLGTWTLDYKIEDVADMQEAMSRKIGEDHVLTNPASDIFDDLSIRTALKSDVIVLALGEGWQATGEANSVTDLSLSTGQIELIRRMKRLGKKVVGVFFCGRPVAMEGIVEYLDAILYAWHSGTETANAACDILFGDVVPSGRTAITFPWRTGHVPLYYNVTSSGRDVNGYYIQEEQTSYVDSVVTPAYPFGYGLSYTSFQYGNPVADRESITLGELREGKKFRILVEVKNTGAYDGKEVVQLYIHDRVASMMRPMRELKAFRKQLIRQGETAAIEFEIGWEELGFYTEQGAYIVEAGEFDIFVGENCLTDNGISIAIVEEKVRKGSRE